MKKILFVVASAAVFASCNPRTETPASKEIAKHDSPGGGSQPGKDSGDIEKVMITVDTANAWIQNYHTQLKKAGQKIENVSYMINADALRNYLNNDTAIHKVDLYLAKKSDDIMTLVYIGAKRVDTNSREMWVEVPVTSDKGIDFVFDHGFPCPTCDRIGIHSSPRKAGEPKR